MSVHPGLFRHLYNELLDCDDRDSRRRLLDAQGPGASHALVGLGSLGRREPLGPDKKGGAFHDEAHIVASWELYALSRVSDYLLELACPPGTVDDGFGFTGGRRLEVADVALHRDFFDGLGFDLYEADRGFSPFHHEIFSVVTDEVADDIVLEDVLWPGCRLASLLFCRAGVRVRGPAHLVDPVVATTSTLYLTSRRDPRPTNALSHGWGHSSMWRTRFHRFYEDDEGLHLNWDGDTDIGVDLPASPAGPDTDEDRPVDRRRELLLHRCLVRAPMPTHEDDRWPYRDRLSLPR